MIYCINSKIKNPKLFFNWKIPKQKLKDGQSLIHYVVVLLVEELA
jgi:hypothetical protein